MSDMVYTVLFMVLLLGSLVVVIVVDLVSQEEYFIRNRKYKVFIASKCFGLAKSRWIKIGKNKWSRYPDGYTIQIGKNEKYNLNNPRDIKLGVKFRNLEEQLKNKKTFENQFKNF